MGDVVSGQGGADAVALVFDLERSTALVDGVDLPAVVVVDPVVGPVGEAPVVASSFDVVADADRLRTDVGVHAEAGRLDFAGNDTCRSTG